MKTIAVIAGNYWEARNWLQDKLEELVTEGRDPLFKLSNLELICDDERYIYISSYEYSKGYIINQIMPIGTWGFNWNDDDLKLMDHNRGLNMRRI